MVSQTIEKKALVVVYSFYGGSDHFFLSYEGVLAEIEFCLSTWRRK